MATLASDWVYYTNHILQTYRQGDVIPASDTRAINILSQLKWTDSLGNTYDTLLAPGEAAVSKVEYWEIGDEPEGNLGNVTFTPSQFTSRYKEIANAMRLTDAHIKMGPVFAWSFDPPNSNPFANAFMDDAGAHADFVSHHPYNDIFADFGVDLNTHVDDLNVVHSRLNAIKSQQQAEYNDFQGYIDRRQNIDPTFNPQLIASEWNPSSFYSYFGPTGHQHATMGHALGMAENVFTFAELNYTAAHYWIWGLDLQDGTELPGHLTMGALKEHMGDTLVDSHAQADFRLYTTRDSETGKIVIWGLNFSNDQPLTMELVLQGLVGADYKATMMRLGYANGDDLGLLTQQPRVGMNADLPINWRYTDLTGLLDLANGFSFTFDNSTITALILEPIPVPETKYRFPPDYGGRRYQVAPFPFSVVANPKSLKMGKDTRNVQWVA